MSISNSFYKGHIFLGQSLPIMSEFKIITIDKGASSEITRESYSLDRHGISNWLINKNIIGTDERLSSYYDLIPWKRTGGETYSTTFEISTNKSTKQILIKALVTLSPEKSLLDWKRRREILYTNGIPVSNWYYFGDALIFEDYYPKTIQNVEFERILDIGQKLDLLGFSTLQFTDDIRADINNNPFFIDFGFDLGEPSANIKTTAKDYLLIQYPAKIDEIMKFYVE